VKPIAREEILDLVAYEKARDAYRRRIIALKAPRRISVGPELTFIFENRETVLFQIQEMLRAERIVDETHIQQEIDVYNELIPAEDALSATLMIEIEDMSRIRPALDRLIGIDEYVYLDVGDRSVRASFDPKQFEEERISAVQYVRFPLGADLAGLFRAGELPIVLRVAHPNYQASTAIKGESRQSLARDLDSGATP
jgi:hypothetical protein